MTETTKSPSQLIDDRIAALGDWRGEMLAHLRSIILATDSDIVEEWKWRGVPVWRSEEHTSELQSLMRISYAVFCLKKKKLKSNHKNAYLHHHNTSKIEQTA